MSRMDKLSTYRTSWATSPEGGTVTYANTEIVRWRYVEPGNRLHVEVTLRTGGWDTVTTRRKMNQASRQFGLGFGVYRRAGESYVNMAQIGPDAELVDGMTFEAWRQL